MALSGLRLFGVASLDDGDSAVAVPDVTVIPFARLGAVVRGSSFAAVEASEAALETYRRVVHNVFERAPILPAPFGTVFRSTEHVRRWLDMNYIALSEGIRFVNGRCEARVHITERSGPAPKSAPGQAAAVASDAFRLLRRHAVAAVPLRGDGATLLSGAFLVPADEWEQFTRHVREIAPRHGELEFEQTGPWPPYDFVRVELGA